MLLKFLGKYRDAGLLLMRLGVGAMFFFVHGAPKLFGGTERWTAVGGAMAHLGITWMPVMWGFLAACTEFFGGLLLIIGLFFRPACLFLGFVMVVAATRHLLTDADPLGGAAHAIELAFVFYGLMLIGPGKYSVDKD